MWSQKGLFKCVQKCQKTGLDAAGISQQGRAGKKLYENLLAGEVSASDVPREGGGTAWGGSLCSPHNGSPHLPFRPDGAPPPSLQGHRDSLSEQPEAGREALLVSPSGW